MTPAALPTAAQLPEYDRTALADSFFGYLSYLQHVLVDARPQKKPFRRIAESWQWDRAHRSAPAIDDLCGKTTGYAGPRSFWNCYHKGSDKTHDNARELLYLLAFSKTPLKCYVCSGSEDQAALITTAMQGIIRDNAWIGGRAWVTQLTGGGASGSELVVLPMNSWTGQGIFPDYMVASEVTHWKHDEGKRFWDFILESIGKRAHSVLKVETNAGVKNTWQWDERNSKKESPFWDFYEAPEGPPLGSWMNQARIDDDSQNLDAGEKDRLYRNRWIDPGEEHGYLTLEDARACIDHRLIEQARGFPINEHFAVIDYGGVDDRTALLVGHLPAGEEVAVVDRLDCWQGSHENRIDILYDELAPMRRSVQNWIDIVLSNFPRLTLVLDPAQLEGLAIHYDRRNVRVIRFEYRGGKNNHRMAQMLKTAVQNKSVRWSPHAGRLPPNHTVRGRLKRIEDVTLEQEMSMLVVKRMSYGYRFDHEAGRHDDRSTVVGMFLLHAFPEGLPQGTFGPEVVHDARKAAPMGAERTQRNTDLNQAVRQWNIFGTGAKNPDAWDRE